MYTQPYIPYMPALRLTLACQIAGTMNHPTAGQNCRSPWGAGRARQAAAAARPGRRALLPRPGHASE